MAKSLINEIVTTVVEDVLKQLLGKSQRKTTTKRVKRQTRSASTGRFTTAKKPKAATVKKPVRKQVSRRRTAASRSKQRKA